MQENKPVEEMTRGEIESRIIAIRLEIVQGMYERLYRAGIFERPKK